MIPSFSLYSRKTLLGDHTMSDPIDRRRFLGIAAATAFSAEMVNPAAGIAAVAGGDLGVSQANAGPRSSRAFLTPANDFFDVSRGNPKPFTLKGECFEEPGSRRRPGDWRSSVMAPPKSLGPAGWKTIRRSTCPS